MKIDFIKLIKTLIRLFLGLFIYALSTVMSINANLGLGPWNAFHVGLSLNTPLTIGKAQVLVGLLIILVGMTMKQIPGWGTLLNMYFIGTFVDIINDANIVPKFSNFWLQLLMLIVSMFALGYGTYLYLSAQLGAGPRDGLMVGLVKKTGKPVWLIRNLIEATVLILGVLMGAPIGIGTIIYTLGIGYAVQWVFLFFHYDAKAIKYRTIYDDCYKLKEALIKPKG